MTSPLGDGDLLEEQINMVHGILENCSPEDMVFYQTLLNDLHSQLADRQHAEALAGPSTGPGSLAASLAPSSNYASPYLSPQASGSALPSRKRNLGPPDLPEAKRISRQSSPVTPPSDMVDLPNTSNSQRYILPSRPQQAAEVIDLTQPDPPQRAPELTHEPFPELANAYQNGHRPVPAAPTNQGYMHIGELAQFLDNAPAPDVGPVVAQPQAMLGNMQGYPIAHGPARSYTRPSDAFGQDFMRNDELAQFMFSSTAPGGGYGFQQEHQPVPEFAFPGDGSSSEDYGDFPLTGAEAAAIEHLFENIKAHGDASEDREPTPAIMCSTLKEYQKIGLRWLLKMENGKAKGGILADEMGLGKTVQALSLICARPSNDPLCKTTLIIAPVALMRQWEKEIERHVHPRHALRVFLYWGSTNKKADFARLRQFDVVLTTFGTLTSEFKQKESRKESMLHEQETRNPNFRRKAQQKLSLLGHECMWYRVIIDEAHAIKNRNSIQSKAAADLQAHHRLCMTGTPMMNSVDELFPLLRFLQVHPYTSWQQFSMDISRPVKANHPQTRKNGMSRVQILLKSTMLRRLKTTEVDGQEICTIPPKHTEIDNVDFNDEEHAIYKALESKSQVQFNRYLENNTISSNYASVLVMILRLRQVCCHPYLIKDLSQPATEGISDDDLLTRAQDLRPDVVMRLKDVESFECPICLEADVNPTILMPCGHTVCGLCVQKLLDPAKLHQDLTDEASVAKCPHCRGEIKANLITDYKHFCQVHCPEKLSPEPEDSAAEEADADSDTETEDEDDEDEINEKGNLNGFVVSDDEYEEEEDEDDDEEEDEEESKVSKSGSGSKSKAKSSKSKKSKGKGKGKARAKPTKTLAQLKKESLRNKAAKKRYIRRLEKTFIPSAKISKTMELLDEIYKNDPTEKTLIFSQFTSFLDLVEVPLTQKRIRYQRYDGSMKMDERADAVNAFMDDPEQNIMLVSLKAGNAGLNLWKASQVIMLDPFWNPFVEDQAVDRAHRMPQTREVTVHRVLVPETVEDRICALQDKKREVIGAALDENASKSLTRLSVGELRFLFGLK